MGKRFTIIPWAYAATFACESALEQEEPANGFRSVTAVEGGTLPCGIGGYAPLNASHCFAISAFFIIRILHASLHLLMEGARNIRFKHSNSERSKISRFTFGPVPLSLCDIDICPSVFHLALSC